MAKIKKKNLSEAAQQKRTQQKKKTLNPFEVHINKDKQKVLGRKSKADRGLPGVARAKAINKRKGTLLQEYKLKNKDNVFLDKRIGEKNSGMSQEEKIMARFAAERAKAHNKKNIFNLNDEEVLTHRGQTLEEIEKFDDPKSDDEFSDDDKSGKLDKTFTGAHFGGGILSQSESSMSRKDLIEQLIAESKKRKAEMQKIREQTVDLTEKLDTEWKELLPIVSASKKSVDDPVEKTKVDDYDLAVRELKFEARGNPSEKLKSEDEIIKEEKERLEALEADRLARMKGFVNNQNDEIRHKSADDLDDGFVVEAIDDEPNDDEKQKADHDIGGSSDDDDDDDDDDDGDGDDDDDDDIDETEEKEGDEAVDENVDANDNDDDNDQPEEEDDAEKRILLLESNNKDSEVEKDNNKTEINSKESKALLNRTLTPEEKEDIDSGGQNSTQVNNNIKKKPKKTADSEDENEVLKENTKNIESDNECGESEAEGSDEDDLSDLKESDSSSDDESTSKKKNVKFSEKLTSCKADKNESKQRQLKSILKMDNDEEANKESVKRTEQDIREDLLRRKEIMDQARKELPYTYKAPESFEELEDLLANQEPDYQSVIVDRIIKCNHWSLGKDNKDKLANLFIYLVQHLNNFAIVSEEEEVIKCFQIFDRLCPHLYDLAHGYPENAKICIQEVIKEKHEEFEKNKKKYPELDTLIFFKLVSLLFPTSDFRHPVVTPCLVFMSQILLRSRVRTRTDVAKGLFICTLILEYTTLSKRFSPSVMNFLRGVIYTSTPKLMLKGIKTIVPFKSVGELSNLLLIDEDQTNMKIDPTDPLMKACDLVKEDLDDEFKVRALVTAVNLVNEFQTQLLELEAVYSIFEPIIKLLKFHTLERYPKNVKQHIKTIRKEMETLSSKKLQYIVMEKKRPKALRMYEPRIETVYDGKRHKPMSKEKAEREKLLHKFKREKKGALREIRRDRSFLAKVQIKQQLKSDAERKRKVQEIFGEASMQQHELKKFKKRK